MNSILYAKIKGKKLVNEFDIANLMKKTTNFDDKLKNIIKKLLQIKQYMQRVNKLNELSEKVKLLSTKG